MEFKPLHFVLIGLIIAVLGVDGFLLSRAISVTREINENREAAVRARAEAVLASLPSASPSPAPLPVPEAPQSDASAVQPEASGEQAAPLMDIDEAGAALKSSGGAQSASSEKKPSNADETPAVTPTPSPKPKAASKPKRTPKPKAKSKATPAPEAASEKASEAAAEESSAEQKDATAPEAGQSKSAKRYKALLGEYTEKLKKATPKLIKEMQTEAVEVKDDPAALSELMYDKMGGLADILTEGLGEMSSVIADYGADDYDDYQSWADRLTAVYQSESGKISAAHKRLA